MPGGVGEFLVGIAMACVGGYLLANQDSVVGSYWSFLRRQQVWHHVTSDAVRGGPSFLEWPKSHPLAAYHRFLVIRLHSIIATRPRI
jgi:hypothetical protein